MRVQTVNAKDVGSIWPVVANYLDAGLPKDVVLFDIEDVRKSLEAGEWLLVIAHEGDAIEGAAALSVATHPKCKTLSIMTLGGREGSGKNWFDQMSSLIERVRLTTGCSYTFFMGRDGWSRVRPEFRKTATVYYRGEA